MNSRYYVTLKHHKVGEPVQPFTTTLGRFDNLEAAILNAQINIGQLEGYEVISVRVETILEEKLYKLSRILIRTIRVVSGLVIAFFAYIWTQDSWVDTGNIPLGSLTGNMITSNLFHFGVAIVVCWLCWELAFGEGPQN